MLETVHDFSEMVLQLFTHSKANNIELQHFKFFCSNLFQLLASVTWNLQFFGVSGRAFLGG